MTGKAEKGGDVLRQCWKTKKSRKEIRCFKNIRACRHCFSTIHCSKGWGEEKITNKSKTKGFHAGFNPGKKILYSRTAHPLKKPASYEGNSKRKSLKRKVKPASRGERQKKKKEERSHMTKNRSLTPFRKKKRRSAAIRYEQQRKDHSQRTKEKRRGGRWQARSR